MPGFLVLLFWLWLAVSIGVYLFRFLTTGSLRAGGKRTAVDASEDRYAAFEAQLAAMPTPAEPVTTDLPQAGVPDVETETLDQGTGFDVFAPSDPFDFVDAENTTASEAAAADAVAQPADADVAAQPADAVMDEPVAPAPIADLPLSNPSPVAAMATPPMPGEAARARTLAEALEGIEMPAELVPVRADHADPRHMQFYTDTFAPADVGMSLADELERLGFGIEPISETAIRVDQSHASIEVRILPDLPSIQAALGVRAEEMTPETVVVDFQLC